MSIKTMLVDKLQMAFGDYVEGLTPENLQMQVLAGTIEQRNLKLKKEALDSLNLPISVKAGCVAAVCIVHAESTVCPVLAR